jgi:UDP-N-acetylglucosamine 2-epimerase
MINKFYFKVSVTVQEKCLILKVPCIVLRNSKERQETEVSGAVLIKYDKGTTICKSIQAFIQNKKNNNLITENYLFQNVNNRLLNLILGHQNFLV